MIDLAIVPGFSLDMSNILRLTPVLAVLLPLLVAGCAMGPQPDPGPLFSEIQRDAFSFRRSDEVSYGPSLERTVFIRFQGLTRARAMSLLQADGFTCSDITCRFANADRFNRFEAGLAYPLAQAPLTIFRAWEISFPDNLVNDPDDVQITFSSQLVSDT